MNAAEEINQRDGWMKVMGLTVTAASADEVTCEWDVDSRHHQGYGIVHGGVHCGVIESLASIGAAIAAARNNKVVVGLENTTSFVRAVREGHLRATARPITRGRRSQLWECRIVDSEDRVVAVGRVRLLCLDAAEDLAGGASFLLKD